MDQESSEVVRFDLGHLPQGQMRVAKHKRAYNTSIITHRVLGCKTNLYEIMSWESSDVVRFGLRPLFQGPMMVYWLL